LFLYFAESCTNRRGSIKGCSSIIT